MKFIKNSIRKIFTDPSFRLRLFFSHTFHPLPDEVMMKEAFEFASHSNVGGDYLEFGVWKGRSFMRAFHTWKYVLLNNRNLSAMNFYAFDSFEGLPEIVAKEDRETGEFKKGEYSCSEEEFILNLKKSNVDITRVRTIKGWYDKVLNKNTRATLPIKKASIVYIDADLYESAVSVLDFITDYVVDGTLVIFDDWYCFRGRNDLGEQKAFNEWLAKNPTIRAEQYKQFNWKGNSFILHRNEQS